MALISSRSIYLVGAALAVFSHLSIAAELQDQKTSAGDLTYVGSSGRFGLGYDSQTKLRGEAHWVVSEDSRSSWISEAWASGAAGGLKLNYHWVPVQELGPTSIQSAYKLFVAVDRNDQLDRKLTLGGGLESESMYFGATLSTALSDRRLITNTTSAATDTRFGAENDGREYFYDVVTTTNLRLYERPYEYGFGLRIGRFFDQALIRVSGGLDYEWSSGGANHQSTLSVALEKFIANSPHSFSVNVEAYQKAGALETNRDDQRAYLMYRYELGGRGYRAQREFRMVQVPVQSTVGLAEPKDSLAVKSDVVGGVGASGVVRGAEAKPSIVKRMVKTTATMLSDAIFVIDSDVLTSDAKKALEPIVDILRKKAYTGNIMLTGHTCDLGPANYNLALSERRARSVKKFLVESGGVPEQDILTEGKGKAMPRFPNVKGSRFKNRRVELQFVTIAEKLEDVVVPAETVQAPPVVPPPIVKNAPSPSAPVEWTREFIDSEPAWLRRALHNPLPHKQSVDVYRQQEREVTVSVGDKRYVNRAPTASKDAFSVNQDTTTLFDVLSNDSDPDGNPLKIVSAATPAHGSVAISAGKVSYSPVAGYVGVDSFNYTISDDKGATSSAQVTVTVLSTNRAPVAQNDAFSVNQDTTTQFDVLANDSDPDGNPMKIVSVDKPAHGSATISAGKISYSPVAGFVGADSFAYTMADDKGATSVAQVTVTVKSTNRPPIAGNDAFSMNQGTSAQLDVLANDSDPDGNPLAITSVAAPAHGTATVIGGKVAYTPVASFAGVDTFSYTIADDKGATATASATVTVNSTNRLPVAADDTFYVRAIKPLVLQVLDNDNDPDGDSLTIQSFTQPSTGSIALGNNGTLIFTPTETFFVTRFNYTVSDGKGGTASATVTLIDP